MFIGRLEYDIYSEIGVPDTKVIDCYTAYLV